jgi:putative mRNA 3-end processing factor
VDRLLELVHSTLAEGKTPVIHAYPLGKSQEVTRILTDARIAVLQHPEIHRVSQVYEQQGMPLGNFMRLASYLVPGKAVIVPPGRRHQGVLGVKNPVRIAVTGWAGDPSTKYRLGVDHAIPLSDHADYDELFETVDRVNPRVIYCTHGPDIFVDHLRAAGHNAHPLDRPHKELADPLVQRRLF